jgi:hypothetical protein
MPENASISEYKELRWKALVRQQLRAVYDLFHYGGYLSASESSLGLSDRRGIKGKLRRDTRIKAIAANSRVEDLQIEGEGIHKSEMVFAQTQFLPNSTRLPRIVLDKKIPFSRKDLISTAWHEVMHEQGENRLNRNDFVLASAVSTYLSWVSVPPQLVESPFIDSEDVKMIESAFSKYAKSDAVKFHRNDYNSAEYKPTPQMKKSFSRIGAVAGMGARLFEWRLGVPGIGLIFLRELSRGKSMNQTMINLVKGKEKFAKELMLWYSRHPSMRRFLVDQRTELMPVTTFEKRRSVKSKNMSAQLRRKIRRKR